MLLLLLLLLLLLASAAADDDAVFIIVVVTVCLQNVLFCPSIFLSSCILIFAFIAVLTRMAIMEWPNQIGFFIILIIIIRIPWS